MSNMEKMRQEMMNAGHPLVHQEEPTRCNFLQHIVIPETISFTSKHLAAMIEKVNEKHSE